MRARQYSPAIIRLIFWLGVGTALLLPLVPSGPEIVRRRVMIETTCLGREQYDDSTYVEYYFDPYQRIIRRHLYISGELELIDVTILSPPPDERNLSARDAGARITGGAGPLVLTVGDVKSMLNDKRQSYRIPVKRR